MIIKYFKNVVGNYRINSAKKKEKIKYEIELAKKQAQMDYENKLKVLEIKNKQEQEMLQLEYKQSNCKHCYKVISERRVTERGVTYFLTIDSISYKLFTLKCIKCDKKEVDCDENEKNSLLNESKLNEPKFSKYNY